MMLSAAIYCTAIWHVHNNFWQLLHTTNKNWYYITVVKECARQNWSKLGSGSNSGSVLTIMNLHVPQRNITQLINVQLHSSIWCCVNWWVQTFHKKQMSPSSQFFYQTIWQNIALLQLYSSLWKPHASRQISHLLEEARLTIKVFVFQIIRVLSSTYNSSL